MLTPLVEQDSAEGGAEDGLASPSLPPPVLPPTAPRLPSAPPPPSLLPGTAALVLALIGKACAAGAFQVHTS